MSTTSLRRPHLSHAIAHPTVAGATKLVTYAATLASVCLSGDNAAWILLGLIEASIVVLLAVSLIRGEFLATRRKPFRLTGLSVGLFAAGLMGFTDDMVGSTAAGSAATTFRPRPPSRVRLTVHDRSAGRAPTPRRGDGSSGLR